MMGSSTVTRSARSARSSTGARRLVHLLVLLGATAPAIADAAVERMEGPPPWRIGGRVGFTVDAAAFPDSGGMTLEVYLRIPPSTLDQLVRDDAGEARMRAEFRVRSRFGARRADAEQTFTLEASDTARGQGKVLLMRFPTGPGACRIGVRLDDLQSKKRGIAYAGRNVTESTSIEGEFDVPAPQASRELSSLEFLWPGVATGGAAFERAGHLAVANPERLYGLFAPTLLAGFRARSAGGEARPWRWVARVFDDAGQPIAQRESAMVAAVTIDAEVSFDLSQEPAGAYELEVKAWQEGDPGALVRRARFSVGWNADTWLRNPAELTDEMHFLLQAESEERFARMHPGEQERFVEDFWRLRDPTPETAFNEALDTFRTRVAHANATYTRYGLEKGMYSDQGRVYIRYGEPTDILHQVMPAGDETLLQALEGIIFREDRAVGEVHQKGLGGDQRPYEVWVYEGEIPQPPDADPRVGSSVRTRRRLVFLFVDEQGLGSFTLRYSTE